MNSRRKKSSLKALAQQQKKLDERVHPPQVTSSVVIRRTYRFRTSSALAANITNTMLLGIFVGMGTVANTTIALEAIAAKVHRVRVWASAPSAGGDGSVTIQTWNFDGQSRAREISDVSYSTAQPAYVEFKPRPGEAGYQFVAASGAAYVMTITCPTGALIDVEATHVLADSLSAGVTYSASSVTLGVFYALPLDGSGDICVPVGRATTT